MIDTALTIGITGVMIAMVLTTYRLVVGPTKLDRVLALDTLAINAIALLMLVGVHLRSDIFFEAALLIAMMGFVGTVSLSKHLAGRNIIE